MRVLVVCAKRYNGHELWTALGVMTQRGHEFEVVSQDTLVRDEITLRPNTIDRVLYQVGTRELTDRFDALMFVSGNMQDTEAYWTDGHALALVEGNGDRPTAAICCSVPTIRHAAVGKRVSYFPLLRSRQLLSEAGAILNPVSVTADENIVTAEHQMGSQRWARVFCNILEGKDSDVGLVESNFPTPSRERRPVAAVERLKRPSDRIKIRKPK